MRQSISSYYQLIKPGIVRGNAVHVLAGALLASRGSVDVVLLASVLFGTSLVIASACVVNNYMDRGIDSRMKRTKARPSVTGSVPFRSAMVYSAVLLILGFAILSIWTSPIVVALGIVAYLSYVFVYGLAKRRTVHSTIVGAIPGALPAMAGYVAVTNELTVGSWLVFLLIFIWQMPHFYAISLFRKEEYRSAGLPVLGVIKPFAYVRHIMLGYIVLYVLVIAAMITYRVVGAPSALLLLAGAAYWAIVAFLTSTQDQKKWARSVFGASLVLTLGLLVAALLNVYIPPTL